MSVPTTQATTHANDKQHGTRKRIEKNTHTHTHSNLIVRKTQTKEHYGLAKLMFSGDGQGESTNSTKHNPWDAKLWDTPQNLVFVDSRCVLCSLFCGAFV